MTDRVGSLAHEIEEIAATPGDHPLPARTEVVVQTLLNLLERGEVRAAECREGRWEAVEWVKRGILLGFRFGRLVEMEAARPFSFVDKHLYPAREFGLEERVRIVPGGSTVRRGAYLSPSVVCMPPMYVNVGAWVGQGTMIDSHALVGSCAQIGDKVHLSAAAQIGGVLEPVNASPVVIEDGVMVGGNCGVYEGTVVRRGAVLGAGVILTRATPVYDLVRETVYRGNAERPLEIPVNAVVVPGARRIARGWGADEGIALQTPVIVKYRDDKTDVATTLEQWLR